MWQPFDDFTQIAATVSYSKGYQEPVLEVHEARSEFAKPQPAEAAPAADRETIAFTDTDSGMYTIWPIGQVDKTLLLLKAKQRFILSTSMLPMSVFFMTSWWLRMSRFRRSSF